MNGILVGKVTHESCTVYILEGDILVPKNIVEKCEKNLGVIELTVPVWWLKEKGLRE